MRLFAFIVAICISFTFLACSSGTGGDIVTPPKYTEAKDLTPLEGTWDYSLHAFSVAKFDDNIQVSQDVLNYAFTITPESIYDPYYSAELPWTFNGDTLELRYQNTIEADEFYGYTGIVVDTVVEYEITFNADVTEMTVTGKGTTNISGVNPESVPEEVIIDVSYKGTASKAE